MREEHIDGTAYDVKYSVTANIEDALRKFAELKAAVEELKKSGGQFDIGNLSSLSQATAAEKDLRSQIDQTSQSVAKETAARKELDKATQAGTQGALAEYRARQALISQARDEVNATGQRARAEVAASETVASAVERETAAKREELTVTREIGQAIDDVSKSQTRALNQEVQTTQRRSIQVTQAVQQEVRAKQAEAKAYQDTAKSIDDVTKAMADQDKAFGAQAAAGRGAAGQTALAQFEARRAAEARARSAATATETLISGPNGELIQPGSQNTLKKFLADELRRQQSGQGGFNATQFASMATRAVSAQNRFDALAGSDLSFADIPKLQALDNELKKIQKDFAGNVDIGLWARDLRQNLSDVAEATLGVSKDLEHNMTAVRQEVESTAKLSDILAKQSVGDVAARLKVLMDKIADPKTETSFRTVLAELAGMDSQLAKAAKTASPGFSRSIDESRRALADLGAQINGVSGDLDAQAKKIEDVRKRGTSSPFMIKNAFLTLGGALEEVSKSVDHLGYRFIDLGTKMKGAGGGGGFFNTLLSGAGDAGGFFSSLTGGAIRAVGAIAPFLTQLFLIAGILPGIIAFIGALGTGLIGLIGALAPLVGMLGIFLPIVVSLGIAFGVLTAAVKPVISALSNLNATNIASTKTIAGLSPAAVQAAKDLYGLKAAFAGTNIQEPFWKGANKGLDSLSKAAGPLKSLLTGIAGVLGSSIGNMLTGFANFVNSPGFKNVLSPNSVDIIKKLGDSLYRIGDILSQIAVAAAPFADILVTKLDVGLTRLQAFIDRQSQNGAYGGLARFFQDSYNTASLLWNIVSQFMNGFITLMGKFRPLGDDFLLFLDKAAQSFDKWAKKTNFTEWLKQSQQLLSSVGKVLIDVVVGIAKLGNNANSINFFIGIFKDLNNILPPLFKLLGQVLNLLAMGLGPLGGVLRIVSQWLGDILTWTTRLIDKIESNPTGLRILKDIFTVLGSIVVGASVLAALDKLITIGGMAWARASGPIKTILNALFGTSFGKGGTPADPLGIGPAGTAFAEKLDAAFKAGAGTVAAAITESLKAGGVTAGEEIGTAEAAGGAVAGTEMAGGEAGGGFIGGVTGWLKGGGFSKLLGGAILGGLTASVIAHAQGVSPVGNTQTPQQASQQAFSDALGGAVAGSRFGPIGIAVGTLVGGLIVPILTDPEFRRNIANFREQLDQTITRDGKGNVISQGMVEASPSQVLNGTTYYPHNGPLLYHDPNAGKGPALLGGPNASIHAPSSLTPNQLNDLLNQDFTRNNLPGTVRPGQSPLGNVGLTGGGGHGLGFSEGGGIPPSFTNNAKAAGKQASSSIASDIANAFTSAWQFVDRNFFRKIDNGAKTAVGAIGGFFTSSIPHWYDSFAGVLHRNVQVPVRNFVTKDIPEFFTQTIPHWYDSFAGVLQRNVQTPTRNLITKDIPNFFNQTIPHWYDSFAGVLQRNVQTPTRNFITKDIPSFFNNTIPHWYDSFAGVLQRNVQNPVRGFILKDIPDFFGSTIPHWFDSVGGWFNRSVISPISGFFTRSLPGIIEGAFRSGINWVISNVIGEGSNPSGGIIGFLNKATGVVGVHIPGIPGLATGGKVPGPDYIDHDSVYAKLTPGEFVVRKRAAQLLGPEVLNWLNNVDKYRGYDGGGSVIGWLTGANEAKAGINAVKSIGSAASNFILGGLRDTFDGLWGGTVGSLLSPLGKNNVPAGVANYAAGGIKNAMDSFLGKKDQTYAQQLGGVVASGAHALIIQSALQAAGVPQAQWGLWMAGMNTLINRESGWNANSINLTDQNAMDGTPSEGLAQVIQPTFDANHVPGTSNNIFDPVANVAAAIRYILRTYGSITNVQQANANLPPKGYADGGFVLPDLGFGINKAFQSMIHNRPIGVSSSRLSSGARALNDGAAMGLTIGEMNIHNPIPQQTSETLARSNARLRVYRGRGN